MSASENEQARQETSPLSLRTTPPESATEPQSEARLMLRRRAEFLLAADPTANFDTLAPQERDALLHELRVYHIELELQNEELRRVQHELIASQAHYFDLYNLAPIGYLTLSAKGIILEANLAAADMLSIDRSLLIRQAFGSFILADDQDTYYRCRNRLHNTGEQQMCELRIKRSQSQLLWAHIEMTIPPTDDPDESCCMVISDVTARHQAEESLRELNATLEQRVCERTAELQTSNEALERTNTQLQNALRLKDEFLAMMSHELRTPLNILLNFTENLAAEIYGPISAAQQKTLVTMQRSGQHLLQMISDILDLAHMTVAKTVLDLESVSIPSLCYSVIELITPLAQAKHMHVSLVVESGLDRMVVDPRRLTQILLNLLDNAIKFTPKGQSVGLEVAEDREHQHIVFTVWDTGIGIAQEHRARIFDPFSQVDARLSRQYGGIGLGLALVYKLVDAHNGSIQVDSIVGQGSRFIIRLPLQQAVSSA